MKTLLEVSELVKRFGGHRALDGATFSIAEGSITGLIGPNGAGKTTCFNCVAGSLSPDEGQIRFAGDEITGLPPHAVFRRGITRTFQIPQELAAMSVLENLMLVPPAQAGESVWASWLRPGRVAAQEREIAERARETLALVQLDGQADLYAGNLSGGQRKLLELARALMSEPRMILVDEPSAGVNPTLTLRLLDLIRSLRESRAITFFVIAHDMDLIARLCETLVVMTNGRVLTEGDPRSVLEDPLVQEAYLGSQYR